jgi:hypothetical protein
MFAALCVAASGAVASAQEQQHVHPADAAPGWMTMYDGVVYGLFNHQGSDRGGDEFKAPNWGMAMASRRAGAGELTLTGMISLDPATVGKRGYREIFQVGETVDGRPLVDRQHPHDLYMQLAAAWRVPLSEHAGFTIAGGPAAEPALGPVAFMHRPSAETIPLAPLGHHALDSSHIAFGVVTGAIDRGRWTVEGSLFNGREPDENRWDFDFGRMDSLAGRVWFRPTDRWELQVSTGRLVDPEPLEPGNMQRTTASASWFRNGGDSDFSAVAVGFGVNAAHETYRHALFGEWTRHAGANAVSVRAELLEVEIGEQPTLGAVTVGGARDVLTWKGAVAAVGGGLTFYAVPDDLRPAYGDHPVSFQLFVRLRPPAGHMGRMWNMRLGRPTH